jgi:hypothetical protein
MGKRRSSGTARFKDLTKERKGRKQKDKVTK